jgi:glycosyltransferase involved in cell wall biosynthesis
MADDRRRILVYRESLLQASEPFITAQAEALRRHEPWYLGLRRIDAHPVPSGRDLRWSNGRLAAPRRYAWKRWGLAPATVRGVRGLDPVLYHAHFGRDAVQLLPMLRRRARPLVVTFHGHDALRSRESFEQGSYSDRLYAARWEELARVAARFVAVSAFVRTRLLERGLPAERVVLHHIGVASESIAAAAVGPRDPDLVLFVGRLVAHKGVDDLIAALSVVRRARPEAKLVVIGTGPERAALTAAAAAARVPTTFLGALPATEVWAWMGRAAAVAVPSRSDPDGWQEAFGLVAAEAQAAGATVVASRSGGLPEAVSPANDRYLFPERDRAALAANLEAALHGQDGRRRDAAARWIAERRDLATQSARLDDLYEEVAP